MTSDIAMKTDNSIGTRGAKIVKASEFKATCLKLMDEVAEGGEEIVITKNGRPVSRLVPYREKPESLLGIDRGRVDIHGDDLAPVAADWDAESGNNWDDVL